MSAQRVLVAGAGGMGRAWVQAVRAFSGFEVAGLIVVDPEALTGAQTLVLEDQVVDWIVGQIKTTEKTVSFDELVEMRQAAKS